MSNDAAALVSLVSEHKWAALGALVIGLLVRLCKSDVGYFPVNIPSRWRPLIPIALGAVQAMLELFAGGQGWRRALVDGLLAGMLPIVGHDLFIEMLRGGREIPMSRDASTTPTTPPPAP